MRWVATFGTAGFPRRTLLGSSLNKVCLPTPRYLLGLTGADERPQSIIFFSVLAHSLHSLWEGLAHHGYRGCGRRNGLIIGGAGVRCSYQAAKPSTFPRPPPKEARVSYPLAAFVTREKRGRVGKLYGLS